MKGRITMLSEQEIAVINELLNKKNDVEIQVRSNGIAILSIKKDIKYSEAKAKETREKACAF